MTRRVRLGKVKAGWTSRVELCARTPGLDTPPQNFKRFEIKFVQSDSMLEVSTGSLTCCFLATPFTLSFFLRLKVSCLVCNKDFLNVSYTITIHDNDNQAHTLNTQLLLLCVFSIALQRWHHCQFSLSVFSHLLKRAALV